MALATSKKGPTRITVHAIPHIGKIFLTGFSANIFRYRDVNVKIRRCVQGFRMSYYTVFIYKYIFNNIYIIIYTWYNVNLVNFINVNLVNQVKPGTRKTIFLCTRYHTGIYKYKNILLILYFIYYILKYIYTLKIFFENI